MISLALKTDCHHSEQLIAGQNYTDLQRILKAEDREKELGNQLRKAKAKLKALGIVTEDIIIE